MSLHRWLTGFALVVFMLIALTVNAVLFSARSFQHNLMQIAPNTGGVISIAELKANDAQIQELEALAAPQRGRQAEAAIKVERVRGELAAADQKLMDAKSQLALAVGGIETRLGLIPASAEVAAADVSIESLESQIAEIERAPKLTSDDRATLAALRKALAQAGAEEATRNARLDAVAAAEREARAAASSVSDINRQILGLKSQYGENYDRIRNEALALAPLAYTQQMVSLHPTFLSTMLVLLMGALGAVLFLFPAYATKSINVTFEVIIVRIIFGMVTALAFYIVANATLAGFTLSAGGDASAATLSLNPFTVSLLGIIAGVMADDIANWIHSRGKDILGGGNGGFARAPRPTATTASADSAPVDETYEGGAMGPGAQGVMGDPFASAASRGASGGYAAPGDAPPRGGVVG